MKRLIALSTLLSLAIISCSEETDNSSGTGYPTTNLTVEEVARPILWEKTSMTQGLSPVTAETTIQMLGIYGKNIIHVAMHDNDALSTPTGFLLDSLFASGTTPNFNVNGIDVMMEPESMLATETNKLPNVGVTHAVLKEDTIYRVYPKIQWYKDYQGADFFVQSYLLVGDITADTHNGFNLNQTSAVPFVGGTNPTIWKEDAAPVDNVFLVKENDPFIHRNAILDIAYDAPYFYGVPLDSINPFDKNYFTGDILGSENTAIKLELGGRNLPVPFDGYKVMTIVWRYDWDANTMVYENGYVSEHSF